MNLRRFILAYALITYGVMSVIMYVAVQAYLPQIHTFNERWLGE